jgi:hypothetical protein
LQNGNTAHKKLQGVKKMLAYILALVVGIGSLAIYIAAFFFPEIHRKNDFIWSGVGLFYALVLWIFVPRITGGLLLGHVASVALLVWFGWQTLSLRRQLTPEVQQTPIPNPELVKASIQQQVSQQVSNLSLQQRLGQLPSLIANVFSGVKAKVQQTVSKKPVSPLEKPAVKISDQTTALTEVVTLPTPEMETPTTEVSEEVISHGETEAKIETVPEATPPTAPIPDLVVEEQGEREEKQSIAVEEVASETVLVSPAEVPGQKLPPSEGIGS